MDERTRHDRVDREAAGEIIRRAAELDAADPGDVVGGTIERRALAAAAEEVGISPAAMRLAMAEHDAGALVPAEDRSILGPAHAVVVRTVDLPADAARSRLDRWMRGQLLEVKVRRGDEVVWCRRVDLAAKVRRKVDPTLRVRLNQVDEVCASVADVGDGRSIVRLDANLEHTRRGLLTGVAVVPGAVAATIVGGMLAALVDPMLVVAGLPAGGALGGAGLYAGRRTLAKERDEAHRVLQLFLDDLELTR